MPRSKTVQPSTRALVDRMRETHAKAAPTVLRDYSRAGLPQVPEDDAAALRLQRLLEKVRADGQSRHLSDQPTREELDHLVSILMWRRAWGTSKYPPQILPLWLAVRGYPVLPDVVVSGVLGFLYRWVPRNVIFGDRPAREAWAVGKLEDLSAKSKRSHRGDPALIEYVRRTTGFRYQDAQDTQKKRHPQVESAAARRREDRRLLAESTKLSELEADSAKLDWLVHMAGEPMTEELLDFGSASLEAGSRPGIWDALPMPDIEEVRQEMASGTEVARFLEGSPPVPTLIQETRRRLEEFLTYKPLASAISEGMDEPQLLLIVFFVECSKIISEAVPDGG